MTDETENSITIDPGYAPDKKTQEKKTRRRFSDKYKIDIVRMSETSTDVAGLLREEKITSAMLSRWKKQFGERSQEPCPEEEYEQLLKQIAALELENRHLLMVLGKLYSYQVAQQIEEAPGMLEWK